MSTDPNKKVRHNTLHRKQRSPVPPTSPALAQQQQQQQPGDPVRRRDTLIRRRRQSSPAVAKSVAPAPAPAAAAAAAATRKSKVPRENRAPRAKPAAADAAPVVTRKTEGSRETRIPRAKPAAAPAAATACKVKVSREARVPTAAKKPHEPHAPQPEKKARRHSHEHQHSNAPKDAHDTSGVWIRRTIKDRLSLSSVNPRLFLSGIKTPHILQVLAGHAKPKEEPRPPSPQKSKKPPHKHRHRHRHRSTDGLHKRSAPQIPMPMPVDAGAGNREQQELPLAAAPTYEQVVYSMPTPTHIIIPSEVMQQSSQGADLQLFEVNPVAPQMQGPDPACQGQGDLVASRAIPLVYADRKHRLSTASGDDDSHLVRVYKVLGRVSSSMDIGADVAQSPMLVTVARNGSITSETSSMPRRSEENGSSAFQSAMGVMPSLRSPPVMSLVSRQRTDTSSRLRSPTSQGDDSFTTAHLFTGTASPKGFVAKASSNNPFEMAGKTAGTDVRKRRDSDVSDIAMRRHLIVDENSTATVGATLDRSRANSVYSDFELPVAANRTFSEWLLAQKATGQSSPKQQATGATTTIAQAVNRSPSAVSASRRRRKSSSDGSPRVQSYQRHYYPPVSHVLQAVPNDPLHGPNEKQALSVLQARVSDLETRFTCMEALLASVEDELSELAVTPRTLGRLRRAVSATRLPAGVRPVVGAVTLAPSVAGLQSQAELTSSSLLSSAYGPGDGVSDDTDREDTVVAVQTTAAALAALVAKSRKEFDEATNNALSSISALVNGMQTMRRLDKNLADTADAELSGQTPKAASNG